MRDEVPGPKESTDSAPSTGAHLRELLRGAAIRRVAIAQILAGSIQFGLPFYAVFARDQLGFGGAWLGSLVVAQTLGFCAAGAGVAHVAGRYGARTVVYLSSGMLIAIPICCWLAAVVGVGGLLLAAFFIAGAARGASQAGFWQYVLELVPATDRRLFMGLANTANAPTLLMPVLGGSVLQFGSFEWLFGGSVVLATAATLAALGLPTARVPER